MTDEAAGPCAPIPVPEVIRRLRDVLAESLALWRLAARTDLVGDTVEIHRGSLRIRIRHDVAHPVAPWWMAIASQGSEVQREKPCSSTLGVLSLVRRALDEAEG